MVGKCRSEFVILKFWVFSWKSFWVWWNLLPEGAVLVSLAFVLRSCCVGLRKLNWNWKKRLRLFCQKESCSRFWRHKQHGGWLSVHNWSIGRGRFIINGGFRSCDDFDIDRVGYMREFKSTGSKNTEEEIVKQY